MASGDSLSIGISGLLAFQRSLSVTGHNISNVNTEGYSRQRAEIGTRPPQFQGGSFLGSGVQVESVRRIYDQFITEQIRTTTSLHSQNQTLHELAGQLDNILADPDSGLMPVLQSFFSSVQDLANDPSSVPARQVVLGEAESLTARFNDFYDRMDSLRSGVNSQMTTMVDEINSIAASIAEVNNAIRNAPRKASRSAYSSTTSSSKRPPCAIKFRAGARSLPENLRLMPRASSWNGSMRELCPRRLRSLTNSR